MYGNAMIQLAPGSSLELFSRVHSLSLIWSAYNHSVILLWIPSKLLRRCPRLNIIICPWSDQSYREIMLHYMSSCIADTSVSYTLLLLYYTTNSNLITCSAPYLCFISASLLASPCCYACFYMENNPLCVKVGWGWK